MIAGSFIHILCEGGQWPGLEMQDPGINLGASSLANQNRFF